MANDEIAEVHRRSYESFQSALAQENANYQTARLSGDIEEMSRAATQMAGYRASMRELNAMANEAYQQQRAAAPRNRYGLSDAEVEVANNSFTQGNLSNDEKQRLYYENRDRYRRMVATGEYSNHQGSVKR